jgi:hypothetical protein
MLGCPSLTAPANVDLLDPVHRILKQALVAVLFVVTASGGGHGEALRHVTHGTAEAIAEYFGTSGEGARQDGATHRGHEHTQDALALAACDHDNPAPAHQHSGHSCAFGHVHCCAPAILSGTDAIVTAEAPLPRVLRSSAVPYGQRSHPPLRPPRSAA